MGSSPPPIPPIATVTHGTDRTEIRVVGTLDHTSAVEFEQAFTNLRATVVLNLGGITRITSYGVGMLMRHLAGIGNAHKVEFAECSETMVDQFQMLQFSRYGRITSFYARYACTRCGRNDVVLLDVQRDLKVALATRTVRSPEYPCACGGRLVVDDSLEFVIEHA
jgi:anti-anti-sigma regulatory factor